MNKFLERALNKTDKMSKEQLIDILLSLKGHYDLMENVFDSLFHGIIIVDMDLKVLSANRVVNKIFLGKRKELVGSLLWDIIDDQDISNFIETIIFKDVKYDSKEFSIDRSGNRYDYRVVVNPLIIEKKISGHMILFEDITEAKKRDNKLVMAEKLASMTTLTASVAHEIKNPLGAVSIYIQLIQKALNEEKKDIEHDSNNLKLKKCEKIEGYIDIINEEVDRLNSIVLDFLFAVKPIDIHKDRVYIDTLIDEVVGLVKYEFNEKNIDILVNYESSLPFVDIDYNSIKQCLLNILINAKGAIGENGQVNIDVYMSDGYLNIDIEDNGVGIKKENLAKIFEPYFSTKDTGSGLGLTIVYKIVKEHNGDIKVNSKLGEGSIFTIILPVIRDNKLFIGDGDNKYCENKDVDDIDGENSE